MRFSLSVLSLFLSFSNKFKPKVRRLLGADYDLLSTEEKRRILLYNSWIFLVSKWFCTLRNQPLAPKEATCLIYMASLTPLIDDLQDESAIDKEGYFQLVNKPKDFLSHPGKEGLIAKWILACLEFSDHKDVLNSAALAVADAQWDSNKLSQKLDASTYLEIAKQKGASSLLMNRQGLHPPASKKEISLCTELGYFMQLSNDIFDLAKDRREGLNSWFTAGFEIEAAENIFDNQWRLVLGAIKSCEEPIGVSPTKDMALVASRAYVALNHYSRLSKASYFKPSEFQDKELLVDVETIRNFLVWRKAYYRLLNKSVFNR